MALLCCQLCASNKIECNVSFEYWLNDDLKIISVEQVIMLEIDDDSISVTANNWFGTVLLGEPIEFKNQSFLENNIFNIILLGKSVSEEGSWVEGYSLLNNKEVKVRFLFSAEENDLKLYRMDVRELNKDNDNNKINNVILNNDIIMVWTNLEEEIIKISLRHNGANYVIKLNEE
jgi:hypothetical protein